MVATASGKGWVHSAIEGGIYIDVPEDEDKRDSYSPDELSRIFAHPIFRSGERLARVKACGELQFWLPLLPVIDAILEADRIAQVEQRHTAKRIFKRLRDEHGYAALWRMNLDLAQLQNHLLRTRFSTSPHVQLLRS